MRIKKKIRFKIVFMQLMTNYPTFDVFLQPFNTCSCHLRTSNLIWLYDSAFVRMRLANISNCHLKMSNLKGNLTCSNVVKKQQEMIVACIVKLSSYTCTLKFAFLQEKKIFDYQLNKSERKCPIAKIVVVTLQNISHNLTFCFV